MRGLLTALAACAAVTAYAQPRTDVVTLENGDRITGEIVRLDRGRLEFETDDAGTILVEWNKLTHLEAARLFDVGTQDGRRLLGSLASAPARTLAIAGPAGTVSLPMAEVTQIVPIGASFWKRLDGSVDAGFSYTRSSGVAQLNVNSVTAHRRPASEMRLAASATLTQTSDGSGRDDRGAIEASYVRYRQRGWFVGAMARFESNESLGLQLRSQVGAAAGPRFVNTNRAQLTAGAGLAVNDERGVDAEPTQNVEGVLLFRAEYFTYDRPRTSLDVRFQHYPGLSDLGRHRLQLDASIRQEFWKDLFLTLALYDSFDSRPPNARADENDVGISFAVGWSY